MDFWQYAVQLVLVAAGAFAGAFFAYRTRRREKRIDDSHAAAFELMRAAHLAAHYIGVGVQDPAMSKADRVAAFWTVDNDVWPRFRLLQIAGANPATVLAGERLASALTEFRGSVAKPSGDPGEVPYQSAAYLEAYEPYRLAREAFIAAARAERGNPDLGAAWSSVLRTDRAT